ncbi:S8 family serine peptidase [Mycetocola saprophilus]|uniref:S8 family serine peptidase n=1 Tax=Mycetocola saprophilus TaxID=76636 RepID=UPI003BF450F0
MSPSSHDIHPGAWPTAHASRLPRNGSRRAQPKPLRRWLAVVGCAAMLGTGAVVFPAAAGISPAIADDACTPGVIGRIAGPPSALTQLEATPAVPGRTGAGVTIAVVDSGIDVTRPQLADALVGGISLINDGERPDGFGDPNGHGTAIAGLIAARPAPGSGVIGLAPEAKLLSVRVYRDTDKEADKDGFGLDAGRMAEGIRWATAHGAQIISVSLSDDLDTPELRAAVTEASAAGSLVVASAGNRTTTRNVTDSPRFPAAYPEALAVTAVDTVGAPNDSSIHGDHIEVAAPGQDVLTTATGAGDCRYSVDAPSTSFATGYAAAAAALVAQAYPSETPREWAYRLMATADRPNADKPDPLRGWGLIRPFDAIALHPDTDTRGPASPFVETNRPPAQQQTAQLKVHASDTPLKTAMSAATVGGSIVLAILAIAGLGWVLVRRRRDTPGR